MWPVPKSWALSQTQRFCWQKFNIKNENIPEKFHLSKHQKPCNFWGKRNTERWQVYALGQFFSEELYYHSFFSSSLFKCRRRSSAILSGTVSERGNGGEVTVQFRPEFKLLIFFPLSLSGSLRAFNSNAPILPLSNCYYSHSPISQHPSELKNSRSEKYLPRGTKTSSV